MDEGKWITSPDAIAFDSEGRLINGQHRLQAAVQADEPIEDALVASGLPTSAFKIADMGAKRTAADVLRIEGFRHPQELGAVMKLLVLWAQDRLEKCNEYEVTEKFRVVRAAELTVPRAYKSIERVGKHKQALKGSLPRSLVAFTHFLYRPAHAEAADSFIDQILTGKGIVDWVVTGESVTPKPEAADRQVEQGSVYDSPAYLLRRKITSRRVSASREKWLAWLIQSFNWHVRKEPHGRLRYRPSDQFPRPEVRGIPELEGQLQFLG
ncbi:hypothetical protein [Salinibacter ruber]|uniref:hypothetical protein n=1 Tax=Salinibacter ruber TaxID=146919 RepID=UPI002168B8FA|nr:hypothetical protein [Salinibacter ruber]